MVGAIILEELMVLVRERLDMDWDDEPFPADYFDLIGGSGTGGLLAIMVGQFGMSAQESTRNYRDLSKELFQDSNKKSHYFGPAAEDCFKAATLEKAFKSIVRQKNSLDHRQEACSETDRSVRGCKV